MNVDLWKKTTIIKGWSSRSSRDGVTTNHICTCFGFGDVVRMGWERPRRWFRSVSRPKGLRTWVPCAKIDVARPPVAGPQKPNNKRQNRCDSCRLTGWLRSHRWHPIKTRPAGWYWWTERGSQATRDIGVATTVVSTSNRVEKCHDPRYTKTNVPIYDGCVQIYSLVVFWFQKKKEFSCWGWCCPTSFRSVSNWCGPQICWKFLLEMGWHPVTVYPPRIAHVFIPSLRSLIQMDKLCEDRLKQIHVFVFSVAFQVCCPLSPKGPQRPFWSIIQI